MKQKLKNGFIRRHMDDESIAKYEHMLEKRAENAEKLKSGMIGHLSALTDGVTAIFITVMMLEIPYPTSEKTYWGFLWSILVFLVSFFIIADFCAGLTAEKVQTMLEYSLPAELITRIPEFTVDYEVDLVKTLKKMGLTESFDDAKADFRPMVEFPGANAYIGAALQKTHFELDEKGVKAAAVTLIEMYMNSSAPGHSKEVTIYLDRPFVYMIIDDSTKLPLFIGVANKI